MSMTALVILQFMGIFAAYTGITTILPAVMFRRILKGRRLPEQFLMCYTFGNFYIINIVFVLQLLHISNRYTLTAVTVAECCNRDTGKPDSRIESFEKKWQNCQKTAEWKPGRKVSTQ